MMDGSWMKDDEKRQMNGNMAISHQLPIVDYWYTIAFEYLAIGI